MRSLSLIFALFASSVLVGAAPAPVEDAALDADSSTADSMSTSCRNPEQRKEWRKFTKAEKAAYIKAVNCLSKRPHTSALKTQYPRSNLPSMTTASSYLDDLIYTHMDLTDQIHYTGFFFPFHRWYVNEHLTQLKTQCGYTGVQPYWDWTQDAASFNTSPMFDKDPSSGLGGFGDPNKNYTVTTGGFANMIVSYPVKHVIRRQYTQYPYLDWYWLQRPTEAANTTITKAFVDEAVNGYVGNFIGFQNATEKAQSFHPNIHMIMGGDMAGTCPPSAGSLCVGGSTWTSNDPLFFLHHAQMDRIWWLWQRKNRLNAQAFAGGSISTYSDPAFPNGYAPMLSKSSVIPTDGMSKGLKTVQDMLSTTSNGLCYVYV
ncbi:tyrosinase [Ceratobasidium sp. AG-Ba]|nr:tyrosinase [Ceratobasidium sp. AG-Ba]